MRDLTLTVAKLERKQKDSFEFKNVGIAKQAEFLHQMGDWMEDSLKTNLEVQLGRLPLELQKVISTGESLVEERLHLLKIADKWGWSAVTEFTTTDLARSEAEEKKLKKIAKTQEAKLEKQREQKRGKKTPYFQPIIRYCSEKARAFLFTSTSSGSLEKGERGSASSAASQATSPETAEPREDKLQAGTGSASSAARWATSPETAEDKLQVVETGEEDEEYQGKEFHACDTVVENKSKNIFDDLDKLDALEGFSLEELEFSEDLVGTPVEKVEVGVKVVDSLKAKGHVWVKFGAGKMVLQVIEIGLRLNFIGKAPENYKEPNNQSFKKNQEFGIGEVKKLLANGIIEEVGDDKVICVNPMVASNRVGKQRLCIDLSRHVNNSCVAKRFKIESVSEFVKVVKQGAWCWLYDLKSAFHHVNVIEKHRKYLGFEVVIDGEAKLFRFRAMPFGYRDASRILTKVMRTPLCKWRTAGIPSFIHIDDGLCFKNTKEEAREAAKLVMTDLEKLGLVTSPDKCEWEPVQRFIWCGFQWDLKEFRVEVTTEKKNRIKDMARALLNKDIIIVREMAAFTGLVISCAPAVGRNNRFYTRFSVSWCQTLVDLSNWGASGELSEEVVEELVFWRDKLDGCDSQLIRHSAGVVEFYVCSDSGGHLIGGSVRFKGTEQVWRRFQITLEEWEKLYSSTYRELRSIEYGLMLMGPEVRGQMVRYGNDNYAACRVVEFGSMKRDCHLVAKRIAALVDRLEMVWRRRNTEEITLCDRLSKDFDLSEYRLTMESFRELEEEFGPWQVDWFASDWSKRLSRFASRYWTVGSEHTDAFSQDWSEEVGFFHPPLFELARVMDKARKDVAKGSIVVPDWSGSEVDSIMIQIGVGVKLKGIRRVSFESPVWRKDDTFRGTPAFGMRVYEMNFEQMGSL